MKHDSMTTPCDDWAEQLATARFATLLSSDTEALYAHILSCETCAAVQREYDEIDRLISNVTCAKALEGLPPQLLQLWEKQDQQIALHTSVGNGRSAEVQKRAAAGSVVYGQLVPLSASTALAALSLSDLAVHCQHEIANFRKGEAFNDQYCLEIFYRAIAMQDDGAWELLTRSFRRMVVGWLRNHPLRESAMRYESEENFVDLTFTRFWRATRNQAVVFHSLAAALTYLKASLHGELQDTIRAHTRLLLPLPGPGSGFPEEPAVEEQDDGRDLWEVIESFLPTVREKQVAYLIIHCGLKPREVIRQCPGEFSDVKQVYRLHRNVLERLLRHADQIRWRLGSFDA